MTAGIIIAAVLWAIWGMLIAERKGYSETIAAIVCGFTGIIGIIIYYCLENKKK